MRLIILLMSFKKKFRFICNSVRRNNVFTTVTQVTSQFDSKNKGDLFCFILNGMHLYCAFLLLLNTQQDFCASSHVHPSIKNGVYRGLFISFLLDPQCFSLSDPQSDTDESTFVYVGFSFLPKDTWTASQEKNC